MKAIAIPGLKPYQFAYQADSGRCYTVQVGLVGAEGEGHTFQFVLQPTDATGTPLPGVAPTIDTKFIHRDGIAARSHGFVDFWKLMTNTPPAGLGWEIVTVPPGLTAPGPTAVSGQNWYAGHRDATKNTNDPNILCPNLGARGDWYVDLDSGTTWKKRMGELEWLSMQHAQFQEHKALGDDQLAALSIPAAIQEVA